MFVSAKICSLVSATCNRWSCTPLDPGANGLCGHRTSLIRSIIVAALPQQPHPRRRWWARLPLNRTEGNAALAPMARSTLDSGVGVWAGLKRIHTMLRRRV